MNLWAIIIGIIVLVGIGIGIYFLVKGKSKTPASPTNFSNPVLLQINVGSIENQV